MSPFINFLLVSMEGFEGMEKFLDNFPGGQLIQPLPTFRPHSYKHIKVFYDIDDVKTIAPDLLKRVFRGGDYAELNAPFKITYSTTTSKISATFKYSAHKSDGKEDIP